MKKITIDKAALQEFFLANVEKFVMGLVALCCILLAWRAFAFKGYGKQPKELTDRADNAWNSVLQTKAEDKVCVVTDYAERARQARRPIELSPYKYDLPWSPSLGDLAPLYKEPRTFNVQELKSFVGRGAFSRQGGGAASGTTGRRYVVLTGVIPMLQQANELRDAAKNVRRAPERNDVVYGPAIIERAEAVGAERNWKWTPIDVRAAYQATLALGNPLPESVEALLAPPSTAFPLPPLATGWDDSVNHESLTGPSFEVVQRDPMGHRGQAVLWRGKPFRIEQNRVFFDREVTSGRRYFAVEYATPEIADSVHRGTATQTVQGVVEGEVRSAQREIGVVPLLRSTEREPSGAVRTAQPAAADPWAAAGAARAAEPIRPEASATEQRKEPKFVLFRFFDFDVQPEKSYVYRVRTTLSNPAYGMEPRFLADSNLARREYLVAAQPAETKEPLTIGPDVHLLEGYVTAPLRTWADPVSRMMVVQWSKDTGLEGFLEFNTARGMFPVLQGKERTDYRPNCTVIDLRGGEKLGHDRRMTAVGEVLVLDANGQLRVYNELDCESEYDQRLHPSAGAAATPGGGRPPVRPGVVGDDDDTSGLGRMK